jgi:hypothetical protein
VRQQRVTKGPLCNVRTAMFGDVFHAESSDRVGRRKKLESRPKMR